MFYDNESSPQAATLFIPENLLTEIKQYIYSVNVEVGGLIIGKILGDGRYLATRIHLSRQVVHGSEVDVEEQDTEKLDKSLRAEVTTKFKQELEEDPGLKDKPVFMAKRYAQLLREGEQFIGQWHSHVNMPVFMSGGDERTLNNLASSNNGTMIMLIMNKKEDRRLWVSQSYPLKVDASPAVLTVTEALEKPMTWKQALQNLRACLFSAEKYRVAIKGEPMEGKIIERTSDAGDNDRGTARDVPEPIRISGRQDISEDEDNPFNHYRGGGYWSRPDDQPSEDGIHEHHSHRLRLGRA